MEAWHGVWGRPEQWGCPGAVCPLPHAGLTAARPILISFAAAAICPSSMITPPAATCHLQDALSTWAHEYAAAAAAAAAGDMRMCNFLHAMLEDTKTSVEAVE